MNSRTLQVPWSDLDAFLTYAIQTYEKTERHLELLLANPTQSRLSRNTLMRTLLRTRKNLDRYRLYLAKHNQQFNRPASMTQGQVASVTPGTSQGPFDATGD